MKWIITWHWTAGAYGVNALEADAYHFIIGPDGRVTNGVDRPEDNIPPLKPGAYAASTLNLNSYNISIALDAMGGATERPFNAGKHPITQKQVDALVDLTAKLSLKYNVPVERRRILSHAEVQPTLGIKQRNKWDIMWLPGMTSTKDPVAIGDELREKVKIAITKIKGVEQRDRATAKSVSVIPQSNKGINIFLGWLKQFFKRP